MQRRPVLTVVMDGVGVNSSSFGNAVMHAHTPFLDQLKGQSLYTTLNAHGTYVGLSSNNDMGNSEVGHNALGSGQVCDQGAKLVDYAIRTGLAFTSETWKKACQTSRDKCMHFIGLLSDGNVHSHEEHLHQMLRQAKKDGVKKVRVHVLLDGRDVPQKSAETYCSRLEGVISQLSSEEFDIAVASGGGRMTTTMDRYGADWGVVERGYLAHVHAVSDHRFHSLTKAVEFFRRTDDLTDQYFPEFVIVDSSGEGVGKISDGDAVIFFNFRGDRAIEVSQAFEKEDFCEFDRQAAPKVFFAGMMEYDGDLHIPNNFLVNPPVIEHTLGEVLVSNGLRQFACSETQKFGHVTYFWNGNRSGKIDDKLEEYLQIDSDNLAFNQAPAMKAEQIADSTINKILSGGFDFSRINFANGDMVGHTGDFYASVKAVEVVDQCIGRIKNACDQKGVRLLITADHGNADEMFDAKESDFPKDWFENNLKPLPKPKTSHTLNQVPFYFYDPLGKYPDSIMAPGQGSIANLASTVLELFEIPVVECYEPSLFQKSKKVGNNE